MSDSPGIVFRFEGTDYVRHSNATIETVTDPWVPGQTIGVDFVALAPAGSTQLGAHAISTAHRAINGNRRELFGGELFERIIVQPRQLSLGFVLSATQFAVEVWNTFRDSDQTLLAIDITGVGGLTLTDPFGEPLIFAALDSFIYQALVPASGPAQIDQTVEFTFESAIPGADLHVTGSRITLWSVAPEWGEGMEETFEFLTDVIVKYSDVEQRRGLRQIPRRGISFRSLALNARDAAGMESLIWGWQNQPYGVPFWPDANPLTSDIGVGSFTIPVDTSDRLFAAGGLVAIWKDEYTFEALSIDSVASDHIVTTSPTQFAWTAGPGTRVVPVFLCRIPASQNLSRFSSEIDQVDIQFIPEAGQPAPAPTTSPTQYKGFDVLEILPNWADAPLRRTYRRSLVTLDPKIGPIEVVDKGGSAVVLHEFPWWLDGHANITKFRAFMLRRFGQQKPFWVPTYDQDLVLANDVLSTDSGMRVKSEFYTRFLFPSPARRYVALIPIDGTSPVYRQITASHDNGDGTEGLTFDSLPGRNFSALTTMVSFLTFGRLADDKISIKWATSDHADALVEVQELPRELP
jgi:hypothetical protein